MTTTEPWCPSCGRHRANTDISPLCPLCDPRYGIRARTNAASAIDGQRRTARDQCPGDESHDFRKDEAPCRLCGRYLTDGHPLPTKEKKA